MQGVALFDWESLEPKTGIYSFMNYNPLLAEVRMVFTRKEKFLIEHLSTARLQVGR